MQSITISIILGLLTISTHGRVVRRSIQNKPFSNAKELLSMKGVSDVIMRSFQRGQGDLKELADTLDEEIASLAELSDHLKSPETDKILDALTEAMDIHILINKQREELSELATQTINRSRNIRQRFREIVARWTGLSDGLKTILSEMQGLLLESEISLGKAKENTSDLREKMNGIIAILRVFKGQIEAAKKKEAELKEAATANVICEAANVISGVVGIVGTTIEATETFESLGKIPSVFKSFVSDVTNFDERLVIALTRPDMLRMLVRVEGKIDNAVGTVYRLRDGIHEEKQLLIDWKDAVASVTNDVFDDNLEGGSEDNQNIFEQITEIIEDGDFEEEIYEVFESLERAGESYLDHMKNLQN